jgi:TRADD-N domain-containing protein
MAVELSSNSSELLELLGALIRDKAPRWRVPILIAGLLLVLIAIILAILHNRVSLAYTVGTGLVGLLFVAVGGEALGYGPSRAVRAEYVDAVDEQSRLEEKVEESPEGFARAQLDLNLLRRYYLLNLQQSRSSFLFGVFCVVLGMATLVTGILLLYSGKDHVTVAAVTASAGVITNFVGATAFVFFRKAATLQQVYFAQLAGQQQIMLAVALADQLSTEDRRDDLRSQLALRIVDTSHDH